MRHPDEVILAQFALKVAGTLHVPSATARGVCLLLCCFPALAHAQSPAVIASVTPERPNPSIRLSESLRATLTFTGPAPLRVELPKPLLAPESDRDWKIQAVGTATVTPLPDGRERWSQAYRLDPYVPGEAIWVSFAPAKVNGKETTATGFEVRVFSTLAEGKAEAARPVTGIEELPPAATVPHSSTAGWWVLVGLVIAAVGVLVWKVRLRRPPVPPGKWAAAAFDRLERAGTSGAAVVEGAAGVVRGFIDRRFGIPAPKLTTTELLAATEQAGWPVEQTDPLRRLLEVCDRAKFAGDVPGDDGCRSLLAGCRDWVNRVGTDSRPG